jgi:hypothetical protein
MSIVFVEAMTAIEIAYAQKVEVAVNGATAWRLADLAAGLDSLAAWGIWVVPFTVAACGLTCRPASWKL